MFAHVTNYIEVERLCPPPLSNLPCPLFCCLCFLGAKCSCIQGTRAHTQIYHKLNDRQPLDSSHYTILFTSSGYLGLLQSVLIHLLSQPVCLTMFTANPDPPLQPLLAVSTASVNPTNLPSNHLASSTTSDHLAVFASSTQTHGPSTLYSCFA